jgi:hypothetical protein
MSENKQVFEYSVSEFGKQCDLIDMVLISLDDLKIAIKLHRHWVCKKIIKRHNITIFGANYSGDIDLVKYMYRTGYKFQSWFTEMADMKESTSIRMSMDAHARSGNFDAVMWLYSIGGDCNSSMVMDFAIKHDRGDMIKWLYMRGCEIDDMCIYDIKRLPLLWQVPIMNIFRDLGVI